jgi:hypothetical protein
MVKFLRNSTGQPFSKPLYWQQAVCRFIYVSSDLSTHARSHTNSHCSTHTHAQAHTAPTHAHQDTTNQPNRPKSAFRTTMRSPKILRSFTILPLLSLALIPPHLSTAPTPTSPPPRALARRASPATSSSVRTAGAMRLRGGAPRNWGNPKTGEWGTPSTRDLRTDPWPVAAPPRGRAPAAGDGGGGGGMGGAIMRGVTEAVAREQLKASLTERLKTQIAERLKTTVEDEVRPAAPPPPRRSARKALRARSRPQPPAAARSRP